jgi:hypothetical protein
MKKPREVGETICPHCRQFASCTHGIIDVHYLDSGKICNGSRTDAPESYEEEYSEDPIGDVLNELDQDYEKRTEPWIFFKRTKKKKR